MGVPDPTLGKQQGQGVSQVHFEDSSSSTRTTSILIIEESNHVSSKLTATPNHACDILRPSQTYSPTASGMVSKIKAGDYAFIWLELPRGTYSVTSRRYRSAMVAITNWYLTARAAQIPCVMIGWLAHLTQHEDVKHIFIQIQDDKQRHQLCAYKQGGKQCSLFHLVQCQVCCPRVQMPCQCHTYARSSNTQISRHLLHPPQHRTSCLSRSTCSMS